MRTRMIGELSETCALCDSSHFDFTVLFSQQGMWQIAMCIRIKPSLHQAVLFKVIKLVY